MKILAGFFGALAVPLMLLNFFGAIVAGIWLAILGAWGPLVEGILAWFTSTFLLGIALLPSIGLGLPGVWFAKKGILPGVVVFGLLANIYILGLAAAWCTFVLFHFLNAATPSTYVPLLIWSYCVATGPWSYIASKEQSGDGGGDGSATIVFFCELAFLVVMVALLFTSLSLLTVLTIFGSVLFVALIFQTGSLILTFLEEKRKEKEKEEFVD